MSPARLELFQTIIILTFVKNTIMSVARLIRLLKIFFIKFLNFLEYNINPICCFCAILLGLYSIGCINIKPPLFSDVGGK